MRAADENDGNEDEDEDEDADTFTDADVEAMDEEDAETDDPEDTCCEAAGEVDAIPSGEVETMPWDLLAACFLFIEYSSNALDASTRDSYSINANPRFSCRGRGFTFVDFGPCGACDGILCA